jgi:hypothetical protein
MSLIKKSAERTVLIVCVGDQDPLNRQGNPGPILSSMDYLKRLPSLAQYRPHAVYLLCTIEKPGTAQATQKNAEETRDQLRSLGWQEVYLRQLDVSDPTDYAQLFPEMQKSIERIRQENEGNGRPRYIINVSPGTGQMEAVWLSFVNAGLIQATLLQVKAPWVEPDESRRVREVNLAPLFESDLIKVAGALFKNYAFRRAGEVILELGARTPSVPRLNAAEFFADLASAYAAWDGFEYKQALEQMDKLTQSNILRDPALTSLKQLLENSREVLSRLSTERGPSLFEGVVDLYHSARRRSRIGAYVEAIWRAWACYEDLVAELCREAIRRKSKLPDDYPIPYQYRKWGTDSRGLPEVQRVIRALGPLDRWPKCLDRVAAEDMLKRTGSQAAGVCRKLEADIGWLAEKRHRAVHEVNPPDLKDCEKAIGLTRTLVGEMLGHPWNEIDEYPFSIEKVEFVADLLATRV